MKLNADLTLRKAAAIVGVRDQAPGRHPASNAARREIAQTP